ncbi:DUF2785 domain-containing protein [Streptomyces sp. NPDC127036]|uniref:DUF2785 domain-containing protein n=1 Tax=Streptomyces sp. NPDC127036 TaxID=3347112 RepID=UPI003669EEDA
MSAECQSWSSIAADNFPYPEGVSAQIVSDELSTMLVSPDPKVRDHHAYTATARWIGEGRLDEVLGDLGDTAVERLTHPEIQARTFAPLVLRCVLARAVTEPGILGTGSAERWWAAFATWYPAERDTRGWDDSLGWLHAVAHGADAAAAFAQALPARRVEALELCARRMTAPTDYRYVQFEDARLARAVCRILMAPGLTAEQATGWLSVVSRAFADGGAGAVPPWAFNSIATLQSLHLHLTRGLAEGGVPPHAAAVAESAVAVLKLPYNWLA